MESGRWICENFWCGSSTAKSGCACHGWSATAGEPESGGDSTSTSIVTFAADRATACTYPRTANLWKCAKKKTNSITQAIGCQRDQIHP
jgi:hypothetical protein